MDAFLIGSQVLEDLFLVVFILSSVKGFYSLRILCTSSLLPSQDPLNIFYGRHSYKRLFLSFSGDGLEQFILCGVLEITSKTLQSHSLIRITWLIQSITLSLRPLLLLLRHHPDSSGNNFSCMTLFNRKFRFSTANSTASSKSKPCSQKSVEEFSWLYGVVRRVKYDESSLDSLSKSFVTFFSIQVIVH